MLRDSFYTPKILADKLVGFVNKKNYKTVADFCVGDGELLRSAEARWPDIKCFGSDISEDAIRLTASGHSNWKLSQIDFLDSDSRMQSSIIKTQPFYDLILLNPPFSCIGGTVHSIEFEEEIFQASTAMKFLITAMKYLKDDGALYAILPTSIAYSQRDNKLWSALEKKHNLSILEEPKNKYFKSCDPNVILVSVNDFSQISKYKTITRISLEFKGLSIFRGKVSMDQINNNGGQYYLVHSTNINNNKIDDLAIKIDKPHSEISGPAVLLPRVGKPNPLKTCIITKEENYILSDCIIAIKTKSIKEAIILHRYILDNWETIEDMYSGTGARYITINKIKQFLNLDILELNYQNSKAI
jgi:hypothetical protein